MPVTTGAACLSTTLCPILPMPVTSAGCMPEFSAGGIDDLYFIPCTEAMTETNVTDIAWWTTLKTAGFLGNIGLGIGSIGKKTVKTEKVASCRPDQVVSITWALKYIIKTIDKTSADITKTQINALLKRFNNFQLIARMCEGADTIMPIGSFSMSDVDLVIPDNSQEVRSITFEITWMEFAIPKEYIVAGLSSVIPKA